MKLIAEGLTSEEIAEQLFISKKTVDRHRANVLEKLGMRNRVELTRYAIRRGLIVPQRPESASNPRGRTSCRSVPRRIAHRCRPAAGDLLRPRRARGGRPFDAGLHTF